MKAKNFMKGIFYGIGTGPGDPELLTVKAIKALEKIDVVIAPKTEKKEGSVALTIARPYLKKNIEIVYQVFPMTKNFADSPSAWEENKREIISLLDAGKNTAFLTLGDPMFFSTYIYIYRLLKDEGATIETIPGINAFSAVAGKCGVPIAFGNDVLAIIPATADAGKIRRVLKDADSAVLMKVYKNFPDIADMLEEENMLDDAVMASRVGLDDEKIIENVAAHRNDKVNYLSTIITRKKI